MPNHNTSDAPPATYAVDALLQFHGQFESITCDLSHEAQAALRRCCGTDTRCVRQAGYLDRITGVAEETRRELEQWHVKFCPAIALSNRLDETRRELERWHVKVGGGGMLGS